MYIFGTNRSPNYCLPIIVGLSVALQRVNLLEATGSLLI